MIYDTIKIDGLVENLLKIESLKIQQKYVMQHGAVDGLKDYADAEAERILTISN